MVKMSVREDDERGDETVLVEERHEIVRLKSDDPERRYADPFEEFARKVKLEQEIVRSRRTVRFIFRIDVAAERLRVHVVRAEEVVGAQLRHDRYDVAHESKERARRLAFGVRHLHARRVVRLIDEPVRVDDADRFVFKRNVRHFIRSVMRGSRRGKTAKGKTRD